VVFRCGVSQEVVLDDEARPLPVLRRLQLEAGLGQGELLLVRIVLQAGARPGVPEADQLKGELAASAEPSLFLLRLGILFLGLAPQAAGQGGPVPVLLILAPSQATGEGGILLAVSRRLLLPQALGQGRFLCQGRSRGKQEDDAGSDDQTPSHGVDLLA